MALITAITSKPHFISPEEHREAVASTPNSFSDIPPVLRYQEQNVTVVLDPPLDGLSEEDCQSGTLYIVESVLAFISSSGHGFEVQYPSITLHAISRDETGPCIYCQLDDLQDADDEESDLKELKIIPSNPSTLEQIFEALSLCASLHPDKMESDDDMGMGMDEAFLDADDETGVAVSDEAELSEVGRAALDYLESIIDDSHLQQRQSQQRPTTTNGIHNGDVGEREDSDSGQEENAEVSAQNINHDNGITQP